MIKHNKELNYYWKHARKINKGNGLYSLDLRSRNSKLFLGILAEEVKKQSQSFIGNLEMMVAFNSPKRKK